MNNEAWDKLTDALSSIGHGLAWLGFWIGLGLYNFQGCTPQAKSVIEYNNANSEGR